MLFVCVIDYLCILVCFIRLFFFFSWSEGKGESLKGSSFQGQSLVAHAWFQSSSSITPQVQQGIAKPTGGKCNSSFQLSSVKMLPSPN